MLGPCLLVEIADPGEAIDRATLEAAAIPAGTERVILKTPNSRLWDRDEFTHDFVRLDGSGAEFVLERGIRLIGIDYLSIGDHDAHLALLGNGVVALEGLDLRGIEPGSYELICLPIRLLDTDGAPARVLLRDVDDEERLDGTDQAQGEPRRDRPRRDEDPGDRRRRRATRCSASPAAPRRTTTDPPGVADAMAAALREAAESAGVEPSSLRGVGVGSPGEVDAATGTRLERQEPARLERQLPARRDAAEALGTRVAVGNDVSVATHAESELGAGRGHDSVLGVFWGTGVGGGLILGGKPWHGRGSAGEIGHMVVKRDGAPCPCGTTAAWRPTPAARRWRREARRRVEDGRPHRPLQADGEARQAAADERHLGARARPRGQDGDRADRPRRQGARRRDRLGRQPARPRDRDPRRRPRRPLRRAPRPGDPQAAWQEPLRPRRSARVRGRRARRPRRRPRRRAAGPF